MSGCKIRQITLGDINFKVKFHFPMTLIHYFREFREADGQVNYSEIVAVTQEEIQDRKDEFGSESFTELNLLLEHFSKLFLSYDRCLFHGVAICIDGRAWLISAPSGTGKSTQYLRWKEIYGEEVRLICGDKPILEFQSSGDIIVHASPWTGKERWKGSGAAKLAGIVYLEQGESNHICPMPVAEAAVPLYTQFLYQPTGKEEIYRVSSMLDRILQNVPIWKLVNTGDAASARLTHDTILQEERNMG